ncbi:molybdenum cofactor guanylyltransferase MobA [Sulfuriferula nivalis]|uniref:Molybdenum cofactor guanylyltransferase n=1 Tax=Sulfuriferula nivalis TaxID=2675298 RepID=A0A809RCN5_9PROT|nr:molybdenum cofactor guanylyltransferase MobA [Sulfuriferula nivalis]BBO99415.1 molybdenum cofactor guanylyltransferase [Sulfuriferula nivalis]
MVDAVILAGGEARRMHGCDKGLLLLNEQPLVQHVITRIAPQVDAVWISANRHVDVYQRFGYPVIRDATDDYLGPLAGVLAGLQHAQGEWVLTVPCDTPSLPENLVAQMLAASAGKDVVVAAAERVHATVMLCRRNLVNNLAEFLARGERKVQVWQAQQNSAIAQFDDESAFANLNTPEQLLPKQ